MNKRETLLKTVLWAILGALSVATAARFWHGLGSATALTDATPWGFWIAFDVMSGVALAAGGFVTAATVYIFGLERYRPFVRPAILTAFLGYAAVAVGLLYDLGLPWRIWHPAVSPQPRSVLFEVAMCVMLYLTVLLLEFSPAILEHKLFDRPFLRAIHRSLKRATIPLVIAGIVLSTLHQSSLGSLFLIAPYRLHPLWYSPIIWILFFISAVGLGLMMVALESFFSSWLFGHRLRMDLLSGLGKAAALVLTVYALVRVTDLVARGTISHAFDGSWQAALFLFELAISSVIPAVLLASKRIRTSPAGMGACAAMTTAGMIGYRFDVCVVAFARSPEMPYIPSWIEITVSLGIVAGAMLVFIFFVQKLRVYPEHDADHAAESPAATKSTPRPIHPYALASLLPASLASPRLYSLAAILAAAVAIAALPRDAIQGAQPALVPVSPVRSVVGSVENRTAKHGYKLALLSRPERTGATTETRAQLFVIDGNRDGRLVLFHHEAHVRSLGDRASCEKCHHQRLPFRQNTACSSCHRDMYSPTDIFDHASHVRTLGGNAGCRRCHHDTSAVKTRATALPCDGCHNKMVVQIRVINEPDSGIKGLACGYMQAMHGLCTRCHKQKHKEEPHAFNPTFATCSGCHRGTDAADLHRAPPYVSRAPTRSTE